MQRTQRTQRNNAAYIYEDRDSAIDMTYESPQASSMGRNFTASARFLLTPD